MSKCLVVIQGSATDQHAAVSLAHLIADIEPEKNPLADVMLSNTHGVPILPSTTNHLARKFGNVLTFISDRRDTGWPAGPNGLFFASMDRIYMGVKREGWDYDAVIFLEPDVVPLRAGWINEVYDEFLSKGKLCGGFLYTKMDHPISHINGAMIISPRIRQTYRDFFWAPNNVGWDCYHAPMLVQNGYASPLFWVDYKRGTIDRATLYRKIKWAAHHPCHKTKVQPCLYHGVKDGSAREIVRRKLVT